MLRYVKSFLKEEEGIGTVEIIILIAVLVGVALLFRHQLIKFVNSIIEKLFPDSSKLEDNSTPQINLKQTT